jgi:hypothetical protein
VRGSAWLVEFMAPPVLPGISLHPGEESGAPQGGECQGPCAVLVA